MKRRTFLATLPPLATATSFAAAPAEKIKIVQFGTKHPHASGKLQAIRSLPELYDLQGVVEPDAAQWERVKRQRAYKDCPRLTEQQAFNLPGLRAAAVETHVTALVPTAMRCLNAGLSIHLDKPAGESLTDCQEMHALATRKDLTIQMGYMLRYHPAFEFLYSVLDKGWLGELTEVSGMMGKFMGDAGRAELAQFEGGGMFELACHLIDQVVTVLGKPSKVTPFLRRSFPDKDSFADNQLAVLEYPKALATVRCNHIDKMGGPRRMFSVTGTEGTIVLEPLESGQVRLGLSKAQGNFNKGFQDLSFPRKGGRYDGEFIDLAKVLRGEKKLHWDAEHDLATHEAVLRASGMLK